MIEYVRHGSIDKAAWDGMLARCPNRLWYARSRVLDRAAPCWDALIDPEVGAIMPLPWRRKWGVDYLYNPYGLQQLGVFAPANDEGIGHAFLEAIPRHFRYVDIWLNSAMGATGPAHGRFMPQTNQTLIADGDIDGLRAAYAKGHMRNLRKGVPPVITTDLSVSAFIHLFERTTGARFGGSPRGGLVPLRAMIEDAVAEGTAEIACIREGGEAVAAACFITWEGRSIFLKSANDDRGQALQAMFHLTDHWIQRHAGTGRVLDLAGSNTPGVQRFNAGFGAVASTYLRFQWNRLPWPFRALKP